MNGVAGDFEFGPIHSVQLLGFRRVRPWIWFDVLIE